MYTCKNCGSHEFGSSVEPDGSLRRLCCGTSWPESQDREFGLETDLPAGPGVGAAAP